MRESLVNMENSRTFADATKTVVSHSVRANGNRSRHQVVSLFYRPSVSRTLVVCPQTAAVQKDSCALRGTAVFVATGRAAVPLLNRLVKKATMQQEEIWKDIEGYDGRYQVSNLGNIRSNAKGYGWSAMSQTTDKLGYKRISLSKNQQTKTFAVHRLVAMAFCKGYKPGLYVNHKDENPSNNKASNLEWCSPQYNSNYGTRNARMGASVSVKLKKPVQMLDADGNLIRTFDGVEVAAEEMGVSFQNISACCKGKRKSCAGYRWRFAPMPKSVAKEKRKPGFQIKGGYPLVPLEGEEWKDIAGFEGDYKVSNLGRVYSVKSSRFLKIRCKQGVILTGANGYRVSLYLPRLVALTFIGNAKDGMKLRHINGDITDHRACNLEWSTFGDILHKGGGAERIATSPSKCKSVLQIDEQGRIVNEFVSITRAAEHLGVSKTSLWHCLQGKTNHAGGYKWKYKNNNEKK